MKRTILIALVALSLLTASIGGTIAWYTDEVVAKVNTITAGNLDIELYHETEKGPEKVDENYKIFDDESSSLWEPGKVIYENLTVKNVGDLALEYRLNVTGANQNYVKAADGTITNYSLLDVLKYGIIDGGIAANSDRNTVLGSVTEWYSLNDANSIVDKGLVKDAEQKIGLVVYWAPTANDNNWNVNNGKKVTYTVDGVESLYVELGINVDAKQKTEEFDGFGTDDYDKDANYDNVVAPSDLPAGSVTVIPNPENIFVAYDDKNVPLKAAYTFATTETADQAENSKYALWHADFVVTFNKDIAADSVLLAGQYDKHSSDWIGVTASMLPKYKTTNIVPANTPIRLLASAGDILSEEKGEDIEITINYEELCSLVKEFNCGIADMTGKNAGTTVTVDLRLYEVEKDNTGSSQFLHCETGNSFSVKRTTFTF